MRDIVLHTSSSIRTVTVGLGVSPSQRMQVHSVADCTASGEFRPALKTLDSVVVIIISGRRRNATPKYRKPQKQKRIDFDFVKIDQRRRAVAETYEKGLEENGFEVEQAEYFPLTLLQKTAYFPETMVISPKNFA